VDFFNPQKLQLFATILKLLFETKAIYFSVFGGFGNIAKSAKWSRIALFVENARTGIFDKWFGHYFF